ARTAKATLPMAGQVGIDEHFFRKGKTAVASSSPSSSTRRIIGSWRLSMGARKLAVDAVSTSALAMFSLCSAVPLPSAASLRLGVEGVVAERLYPSPAGHWCPTT